MALLKPLGSDSTGVLNTEDAFIAGEGLSSQSDKIHARETTDKQL